MAKPLNYDTCTRIRLNSDQFEAAKRTAKSNGKTVSEYLRETIARLAKKDRAS